MAAERIKAAYPMHPEIFDRLYADWSTLVKFQRTRGVLRRMAAVIHSLWEKGDKNPLILPADISIDDPRVQFEPTRYLPDTWFQVIKKDVDGPSSLPLRLDGELPNLGKFAACRCVARTIHMGSAPLAKAAHRGFEDRLVKLGCVIPGESPAVFGDVLRRLAGVATYLYQDGPRYWYSTQPTVTQEKKRKCASCHHTCRTHVHWFLGRCLHCQVHGGPHLRLIFGLFVCGIGAQIVGGACNPSAASERPASLCTPLL